MVIIDDNDKCYCSSNKEYSRCCKPLIEKYDSLGLFKISNDFINKKEYSLALQHMLASYSSYMIKIKSHTEKFKFPNEDMKNFLVEVDVNALGEILDNLIHIIMEGNISFNFPEFLKKSRKDFYNINWHSKLDYYMIYWYYICKNDEERAIKYIDDNINVNEVNNIEFIDIITDVYSQKLPTLQRINLFDKLIKSGKSELKKSNYIMRKAITYLSLNDITTFNELIKDAVYLCDKNYDKKISVSDKYNCAKVYSLYGKQDSTYTNKSLEIYEEILQNNYFKTKYIIYRHIADNYLDLKDYNNAIIYFKKAEKVNSSSEIQIELARTYIRNKNLVEGEEKLQEIDFNGLSNELRIDYLTAYSELCCYKDTNTIDFIIEELKKLKPISNYFSEYIQNNIIMLYEIKSSSKTPNKKEKLWKKLNKIIMLKPNFFGLGIDINETIKLVDKNDN